MLGMYLTKISVLYHIVFEMVSNKLSYTDNASQPLFYVYPLRFDNRKYFEETSRNDRGRREDLATAAKICEDISDDKSGVCPMPMS